MNRLLNKLTGVTKLQIETDLVTFLLIQTHIRTLIMSESFRQHVVLIINQQFLIPPATQHESIEIQECNSSLNAIDKQVHCC